MAHLVAPQPSSAELPVFFNVDGVVGASPAQNAREDVLFVQFVFQVIAKSPRATTSPVVLAAAKQVKVTGTIDPATIEAIRAFQESNLSVNKHTVVDARVSPVRGSKYGYGGANWTIANLNDSLQDRNVDIWPRIDKISGCPSELVKMVTRAVAGT